MVSFSELPAVKKDIIFGAARKIFGPSYFVTALVKSTGFFQTFLNSITMIPLLLQRHANLKSIKEKVHSVCGHTNN